MKIDVTAIDFTLNNIYIYLLDLNYLNENDNNEKIYNE